MSLWSVAAYNLVDKNFGLKAGDDLLVIMNPGKGELFDAIKDACSERGIRCGAVTLEAETEFELPHKLRARLAGATAALITTARSYTHTDGVREAAVGGTRVATNSQLSQEQLAHGLSADYRAVATLADSYKVLLDEAREVLVRSGNGVELRFEIAKQRGLSETGLYIEPGMVGNLPAGEAACGIDELSGEGTLVVDGSWPGLGRLWSPLEISFARGQICGVKGTRADELKAVLEAHGPAARNLAEFGLGMNSAIEVQGNTLLDEKVAGTIHVAVGNNVSFGGSNSVGYHADGVVTGAEVFLDGSRIELPS